MKDILKVLKIGTKKDDYPYFVQHINFKDKIQTCNNNIYVEFDQNIYPIEGCINFFVLEDVLNNCEVPQISQNNNLLNIEDGNYKTDIIIDKMEFPQHADVDAQFVEINEEFLYILKSAIKYTGDGLFSYIYVDENYILASQNKEKFFYHNHTFDVHNVIGINKKIMSVLSDGVSIGTLLHNTVVKFNGGKIIFQIALLDNFPKDEILNIINNKPEVYKLCNIAPLQNSVKRVSAILTNERIKRIKLENFDTKLIVKAESITNGISKIKLDSELKQEFTITIDPSDLYGIDLDYDVFVSNDNKLYLSNEKSEIVLSGV